VLVVEFALSGPLFPALPLGPPLALGGAIRRTPAALVRLPMRELAGPDERVGFEQLKEDVEFYKSLGDGGVDLDEDSEDW
jgi:hypothetical protein